MSAQPTLFDEPRARHRDPNSSHEAAAATKPGRGELQVAIIKMAHDAYAYTAFQIAENLEHFWPARWDEGTIRAEVSRLGKQGRLVKASEKGLSPRGMKCDMWRLPASHFFNAVEDVPTGGAL